MILLSKKKILFTIVIVSMFIFTYMITGYSINGGSTQRFYGSISDIILLNDYIKSANITFYVRWNDTQTQTMDNEDDTTAARNGVAAFDVSLNVVQVQ